MIGSAALTLDLSQLIQVMPECEALRFSAKYTSIDGASSVDVTAESTPFALLDNMIIKVWT